MNKAFVREPDEAVAEKLPEIPLPPPPNPVTASGHRHLLEVAEALERQLAGDTAAIEPAQLERLQRERRYWAARIPTAQVTAPPSDPHEVGFGSRVTLAWPGRGEVTLAIVGDDEADPNAGLVGWRAPVAAALSGHQVGEEVRVALAGREVFLEILAVDNGQADG